MTTDKEGIAEALGGLLEAISKEGVGLYRNLAGTNLVSKAAAAARNGDPEIFYLSLQYDLDQLLSGVVETEIPGKRDAHFLMLKSQFVGSHMDKLFRRYEGWPCSHDKTKTVMRSLMKFFKTGEKIQFNYNNEFTYHLPAKVLNEHDQIIAYFNALQHLYYGNPEHYFTVMASFGEPEIH